MTLDQAPLSQKPPRTLADTSVHDASPRRVPLGRRLLKEKWTYLFILPGVIYFAVFHYIPLLGNVVAFQDFSPFRGIFGSEWIGLENFRSIVHDPEVIRALTNTLIIAFLQIVFAFPAPIILALFLNSLVSNAVKRGIQTIVYLPHFISWVVVISIWQKILGGAGLVSEVLERVGVDGINIMANPETFKILVTSQVIWKDVGWGTIIFFAAIVAIPGELYESAATDGASSWRRMWHITLPGMMPVISMLLILNVGTALTVGFEQMLLQQPAVGADAAQVLDTFVYFRGIAGGDWGVATAAGLIKGVIATILVLGANKIAKLLGGEGVI
ncbi:polysaccharide ABC transporter ATP-binding protein [Brachybacterium vulturis]|uniref:Polysaccharide ABC transporter ATP-binding protein n=1 Tax=Brachybacterium vulturis TaxID=2017484 RepID=A0A291GSK4_9MICO|nr:ABC transporter permease subunit [Brachybacterium vulturis]ATG52986.1 polysaccharide ABC transporter ATP-binding protein [Brachybacterium vulturis]